ncbi:MAG: hypothetical protein SPL99_10280 [Catonella sp.]|nr:hypothetical protein [Catonella sp.]MDY6357266.1 hypothetical protein [Catonella sp.]
MRNSVAVKVSAVLLTGAMLFGGAAGMTRTYAAEKGAAADKLIFDRVKLSPVTKDR